MAQLAAADLLDRMLETDIRTYLADDLLAKMDIATMAYSLEGAIPVARPRADAVRGGAARGRQARRGTRTKAALKAAVRDWVPADDPATHPSADFACRSTSGCATDLRAYAREILLDPSALSRGYFDRSYVERLLDEHAHRRADHSLGIWLLLMLELWHQHCL